MSAVRNLFSRWAVGMIVASVLLMGAASSSGQANNLDPGGKRFDKLGHNLVCMCGCGQIMLECNHVGCSSSEQMRQELTAAIGRGENDDQILAGFVDKYGPVVLAAPTTTGFNRVAWIMPAAVLIAGLITVALVVRTWKHRTPVPVAGNSSAAEGDLDEFRRRAREETSL
jgi:cytochrome c-type biogenesis protein CcmH/NrfF